MGSALFQPPPFALGETLKGTDNDGNLINVDKLGLEYQHVDRNYASQLGSIEPLSGRRIHAVAVRNTSGITLYGKRLAKLATAAGRVSLTTADGYGAITSDSRCAPIDPFIETTGVAPNDIFWVITKGPVELYNSTVGANNIANITVGSYVQAGTFATSTGGSTGGRIAGMVALAAAASTNGVDVYNSVRNSIGRALSAAGTTVTNTAILVDVHIEF